MQSMGQYYFTIISRIILFAECTKKIYQVCAHCELKNFENHAIMRPEQALAGRKTSPPAAFTKAVYL